MAHIKCRYSIPYCSRWGLCEYSRLEWDEYNFCSATEECRSEYSNYERPINAEPTLSNPTCLHVVYKNGEFEKTVQRYEYTEDNGLILSKGEHYNPCDLEYLEIDGRILLGGVEHE